MNMRSSTIQDMPVPKTAQVATLTGPQHWEVFEGPAPQPGPNEVLLAVEGSGVCGSDLIAWEGRPWTEYPFAPGAPGHEGWGTVIASGPGAAWEPGTRAVGLLRHAFSSHAIAAADELVALPDDVPGFPAEAVACALNAVDRADIGPGMHVAVVGIGFQGAVIVQAAKARGARVTACSRRAWAVQLAQRCGADRVHQASVRHDAGAILEALQADDAEGRDGFQVVFEATGHQEPLYLATSLTATRGKLVIAGYHQDPRQVDMQQWNWKGLDVINAHERDPRRYVDGMRKAVQYVQDGTLDLGALLTHRYALRDIQQAFEELAARPDGFLKAVVRP